jgi:hypothetical protein
VHAVGNMARNNGQPCNSGSVFFVVRSGDDVIRCFLCGLFTGYIAGQSRGQFQLRVSLSENQLGLQEVLGPEETQQEL